MQLLHPHLLNQPFGDPALYVELKGERSALLFDLGDITTLRAGKILKISRVFVSHMHMDHFIGFDHLLRLFLARDATLRVYGPRGLSITSGEAEGLHLESCEWLPVHPGGRGNTQAFHAQSFFCLPGRF